MQLRELTQPDETLSDDEHYMLLSLDLANWRLGDIDKAVPDVANVAWKRLTTDTGVWARRPAAIRIDPTVEVEKGALEHGERVRSALERFLKGSHRALRATADAAIDQVRVGETRLRISERGTLEHEHSYVAGIGDGPLGLFLAFLLDPDRRFGRDLRRCRLPDCGRFFFVPLNRKGGRIPAYCPDTDHQRRHDAMNAPKRAKKHRDRLATKHK